MLIKDCENRRKQFKELCDKIALINNLDSHEREMLLLSLHRSIAIESLNISEIKKKSEKQ